MDDESGGEGGSEAGDAPRKKGRYASGSQEPVSPATSPTLSLTNPNGKGGPSTWLPLKHLRKSSQKFPENLLTSLGAM